MSKGDIVLVPFPFTDLSGQKVRPALILHWEGGGDDCVVAFISSVKTKRKLAFDIAMSKSEGNGLKVDSVIKVNKLATLQKKIIIGTLGTLEPVHMTTVDKKLKQIFKLQ